MPTPTAYNLAGDDSDAFGCMLRGSAGIAELVHMMRVYPWMVIESFENYACQHTGVFRSDQPWSLEAIARDRVNKMYGHRTLAKMIILLAHAYELMRHSSQSDPHTRVHVGQAFKFSIEVSNNQGSWTLVWPLLRRTDADDKTTCLTSATERVAVAACQKERAIWEKSAETARAERAGLFALLPLLSLSQRMF